MRIMILGINFDPEIISTGVYTTGLARHLAAAGHDLRVITALPHYPQWALQEGWSAWRYRRRDLGARIAVLHCPLFVPRRPSGLMRLLHHLSFAATALWPALYHARAGGRVDLVLVIAPALLAAPVGVLAARLARARRVLHVQDLEVEAAFATGLLPAKGPIARAARLFEAWLLRRFDLVSTISQAMQARLVAKSISQDRITICRNWADTTHVAGGATDHAFKARLGLRRPIIALYSGNLANKQGLDILPQVARLLAHRDDIGIVICGEGPALADLRAAGAAMDNLTFLPLQPLADLGALLSVADIHLLPQIAGVADLVLPSKLVNILASARPVIATAPAQSALAQEVAGAGLVTAPRDAQALAQAIVDLADNPDLRKSLGQAARAKALADWNRETILTQYEARLRDVLRA